MVSHAPKFNLENIFDNFKDNADMTILKKIYFGKLAREEKNKVEESVYAMISKFKDTPLELDNIVPKDLYTPIENKWHYCLKLEKKIRESTLSQVMLDLTKGKIIKANKKYGRIFSPKCKAFNIL